MTKELRRCPFCGGEAITESRFVSYEGVVTIRHDVICNGCSCKIENFQSKEQAINRWNRREPIDRIVEQLEEQKTNKIEWQDNAKTEVMAHYYNGQVIAFFDAIEIVKGGAV